MPRLAVLGGSSVSTPALALALRDVPLQDQLQLVLHGRSQEKLDLVARACRLVATDTPLTVEHSTDLPWCLDGADLILNQVRVGGLEGRGFDEQFPPRLGLIGEETLGAGGFSNALRTIPVILETCRVIQRCAPKAVIINLTNPASLVAQAMCRYAGLTVVSACDVPVTLTGWIHELLDAPAGCVEVDYLGTNHIGWATAARDQRLGGRNRLDEALERVDRLRNFPFDPAWVRILGVLPGSYLRYYYYRDRLVATTASSRTRANELMDLESEILEAYRGLSDESTPREVASAIAKRGPHWYDEIIVPLIGALVSTAPQRLIVQVANCGRVPDLSDHSIIEIPARVAAGGIQPERPISLPPECQMLLVQNAVYEELVVESIVEHDRGKAIRALVANPLVGTVDKANAVIDLLWAE